MGVLYLRRGEDSNQSPSEHNSQPDYADGKNASPGTIDPWLAVVIGIGTLIVTTLAVFMIIHCIKSRQRQRRGFRPVQTISSAFSHKRNSSSTSQPEIWDLERDMMIRKSLASRSSLTATSPVCQTSSSPPPSSSSSSSSSSDGEHPPQLAPGEQVETTSLRDDWKAWEARVLEERRSSHPGGLGLDQHPAFASHLSVPQPTRMPSPTRGVETPHRI
ncbi:hypothetical protein F5B17DRAFT_221662 [Nemania serpens]|nr:hypothetical protein F5B17DRAFT_221662 [Nemania serpens]